MGKRNTTTEAKILECAAAGLTVCQAAELLQIGRSGLASAVSVLGIEFRGQHRYDGPRRTTTIAKIRQCADLGMSRRQAADQLGVGRSALSGAADVLGISFHGHSGCAHNRVELHRHAAHDPFAQIAA